MLFNRLFTDESPTSSVVPGTEQTGKGHIASMRKTDAACPVFTRFTGMQRTRGRQPLGILRDCIFFQISQTRRELETSYGSSHSGLLTLLLDVLVIIVNSTESGIAWELGI